MALIGNGRQTSLFDPKPAPKPKEDARAKLRAYMADPYARTTKRPKTRPAPPANVPGSPLHLAKYSTKNLTDGNFLELQPSRGRWIVSLRGEFMGSFRRGKHANHRDVVYGWWLLDPMSKSPESRSLAACRRAADLLEAHLAASQAASQSSHRPVSRVEAMGETHPKEHRWTVEVGAEPNPDFDTGVASWISIPLRRVPVTSYTEASVVSRDFINNHALGSGNWTGGTIRDASGKVIGHVSYNGRVWDRRGAGAKEIV